MLFCWPSMLLLKKYIALKCKSELGAPSLAAWRRTRPEPPSPGPLRQAECSEPGCSLQSRLGTAPAPKPGARRGAGPGQSPPSPQPCRPALTRPQQQPGLPRRPCQPSPAAGMLHTGASQRHSTLILTGCSAVTPLQLTPTCPT